MCVCVCVTEAAEASGSAAACPRLLTAERRLLQELGKIMALFKGDCRRPMCKNTSRLGFKTSWPFFLSCMTHISC